MRKILALLVQFVKFLFEHLTIFATLIASTYIVIASQIQTFSIETLLLWIISLLGLLSISILSEKLFKLNKINKNVERLIKNASMNLDEVFFTRKELSPLEERLSEASSIFISGGSLTRLTDEYYACFENKLKNGCTIHAIFVKPYSPAAKLLCENVVYETRDENQYSRRIEESINRLYRLKGEFPSLVKIGITENVPPFGIVATNVDKLNSILQMEVYSYAVPTRERMSVFISPENKKLYNFFIGQIKSIIGQSTEYIQNINP